MKGLLQRVKPIVINLKEGRYDESYGMATLDKVSFRKGLKYFYNPVLLSKSKDVIDLNSKSRIKKPRLYFDIIEYNPGFVISMIISMIMVRASGSKLKRGRLWYCSGLYSKLASLHSREDYINDR